jgi:hypothetical protein
VNDDVRMSKDFWFVVKNYCGEEQISALSGQVGGEARLKISGGRGPELDIFRHALDEGVRIIQRFARILCDSSWSSDVEDSKSRSDMHKSRRLMIDDKLEHYKFRLPMYNARILGCPYSKYSVRLPPLPSCQFLFCCH